MSRADRSRGLPLTAAWMSAGAAKNGSSWPRGPQVPEIRRLTISVPVASASCSPRSSAIFFDRGIGCGAVRSTGRSSVSGPLRAMPP